MLQVFIYVFPVGRIGAPGFQTGGVAEPEPVMIAGAVASLKEPDPVLEHFIVEKISKVENLSKKILKTGYKSRI